MEKEPFRCVKFGATKMWRERLRWADSSRRKSNAWVLGDEDADWTPAELAALKQDGLFQKAPKQTLEKLPYKFKYEFQCNNADCNGHAMSCTDWEMGQVYRNWRRQYGDGRESVFRQRFEQEMIEKFDTHFFVGTVHRHPKNWIIVGLYLSTEAN